MYNRESVILSLGFALYFYAQEEQDEDVRNNPGAYMPEEVMDKCESYKYLNTEELLKYEKVWLEVKS